LHALKGIFVSPCTAQRVPERASASGAASVVDLGYGEAEAGQVLGVPVEAQLNVGNRAGMGFDD
jgi:hypothetical protein